MPDYGDIYGGLPQDWQPDPAWVPPEHWGYGGVPAPVPPPPDLAPAPAAPMPPELAAPDPYAAAPLPPGPPAPTFVPPPPMPDAITGADVPSLPPPPIAPERLDTAPTTLADQWQRDPFHSPIEGDARAAAEAMSPADLLDQQRRIDQARQTKLLLDQARADEANLRQIQQNADATKAAAAVAQAKSDQIVADAAALAGTHIDPDRYMSRLSGGQKIAQILAVMVGGLVSGRTGGPNAAMDLLERHINRDIDAQKADIENAKFGLQARRGAVADEYARTGDLNRAAETVRIATYQAAINKMQTEQQNFDPAGTAWTRYGLQIKDAQARQAGALEAQRKTIFGEHLELEKVRQKNQELAETRAQHRQTIGLGYAQLDAAAADRKAAKDAAAAEKATVRADKQAENVRQYSVSAPRPMLAVDDKGNPVIGPDGKPVSTVAQFTKKNGEPWLLGDGESTRAMKGKIAAASEITDMLDEVVDIRNKVGGEILPWSDARQRLKLLQARLALVRKGGTQGMSSDKDFENLGASIGAQNLTSFIDQSGGLKEARERTVSELQTEMRTHNYDGPPLTFANKYAGATNTPEDDRRKALLKPADVSLDDAIKANLAKVTAARGYGIDINDPGDQSLYQQTVEATRASFDPGASQGQAAEIAKFGAAAAAGDATAKAVLENIVKTAGNARLRELAAAEISALTPKPAPRGPASEPVSVPNELRLQ